MNFEEHTNKCLNTWIRDDTALERTELGLIEEVGEVAGKHKKFLRGDYDKEEYDRLVLGELGDVLFYLTMNCYENNINIKEFALPNRVIKSNTFEYIKQLNKNVSKLLKIPNDEETLILHYVVVVISNIIDIANQSGYTLQQVANANIEKLSKRKINGTIKGSGDDR
ncbi:MAG: hypothetical protein U9O94_05990 [Nanoarchaeota archaeon]|nr:hypothetical protein [Nanoarchaeota archaeon]